MRKKCSIDGMAVLPSHYLSLTLPAWVMSNEMGTGSRFGDATLEMEEVMPWHLLCFPFPFPQSSLPCTFCFHPSQRGMEVAVDGKGNGQMSTTWQTVLLWTLNQLFIVLFHLYLSFSPSFSNHSIHWVFLIYNRTIPWDRLGSFTDWNWPSKLSYMAEQKVWSQVSLIQVQNVVLTSNRWARNTSNFVFLKDYTQTAHSIRTWIEKVFSKNVHSI